MDWNILILKKPMGFKRYHRGIRARIRTLPALIFDNKFICSGKPLLKRELEELAWGIL